MGWNALACGRAESADETFRPSLLSRTWPHVARMCALRVGTGLFHPYSWAVWGGLRERLRGLLSYGYVSYLGACGYVSIKPVYSVLIYIPHP